MAANKGQIRPNDHCSLELLILLNCRRLCVAQGCLACGGVPRLREGRHGDTETHQGRMNSCAQAMNHYGSCPDIALK
jgi:hypothetical protein